MINTHLLFNGFLLSADSLVMSLALGPLVTSPASRFRLAAMFGACDGLAVLAGAALGQGVWGSAVAEKAVPLYALAYGICCLVAAHWNRFRANPRLAFVLPVLMSFDNLAYGVGAGPLTAGIMERALFLGLMSSALAMLGLWFWSIVRLPNIRWQERFAGWALVIVGLAFLMA